MTGQYAHSIDAKGRLFIPAALRRELGQTFHVTVGQDHCLSVYSDESWAATGRGGHRQLRPGGDLGCRALGCAGERGL